MTVAAAGKFIQRALRDRDLVRQVNATPDRETLAQMLAELDFCFNYEEFEQSCNHLLTQCQTYQEAGAVKEIKLWWDYLGVAMGQ